jgi:hypothetical protein
MSKLGKKEIEMERAKKWKKKRMPTSPLSLPSQKEAL